MKKNLLFLVIAILFLSSCNDEDYQKYDYIKFDNNIVGEWGRIIGEKEYNYIFEINEDQKGNFFDVMNDGDNNYSYKAIAGKYYLAKNDYFLFIRDGEKHAKNWGTFKSADSESLIIIREKGGQQYEEKFYRLEHLNSLGYKKSDVPTLYY